MSAEKNYELTQSKRKVSFERTGGVNGQGGHISRGSSHERIGGDKQEISSPMILDQD